MASPPTPDFAGLLARLTRCLDEGGIDDVAEFVGRTFVLPEMGG
jgi:hypothetical protein